MPTKTSSRNQKEHWIFVDKKSEEAKHRTEWCANASKYRCLRRGGGSKHMKLQGTCTGPKYLSFFEGKWESDICGKKNGQARRCLDLVQKMLGICETKNGTKIMNCRKPEQVGTKEYGKVLKRIQAVEDGGIPAKEARNWKIEEQKRWIRRKEYRRLWNEFEM